MSKSSRKLRFGEKIFSQSGIPKTIGFYSPSQRKRSTTPNQQNVPISMTNFTENQQLFSIFVETLEPSTIAKKSLSSYISYILQRVHNGVPPPNFMIFHPPTENDPTVIHGFVAKVGSQKRISRNALR